MQNSDKKVTSSSEGDNSIADLLSMIENTTKEISQFLVSKQDNRPDLTTRFNSLNELGYEHKMPDGFRADCISENETVVLDAGKNRDSKLAELIKTTETHLKDIPTAEAKAIALAELVVNKLKGTHPLASYQYAQIVDRLRANTTNAANTSKMVEVPMDALIGEAGLEHHMVLLYKYLADRTIAVSEKDSVTCHISRRCVSDQIRWYTQVRINNSEFFLDLYANPPRLMGIDTTQGKAYWNAHALPKNALDSISFKDLPSRGTLSPTTFHSVLKDRRVFVRTSVGKDFNIDTFIREMNILAADSHPSIIRVRAICTPQSQPNSSTSTTVSTAVLPTPCDTPTLVMVRDFLEAQPLVNVLSNDRRKWTFARVVNASTQLTEAVSKLHSFGMIVRDLSPAHLLITPVGDIRVGDFDLSRYATERPPLSVGYQAPEHYDSTHNTTGSIEGDIYSLGCVLYAIAVGHHPWTGMSDKDIRTAVLKHQTPPIPNDIHPELASIIKQCLHANPNERPTMEKVAISLRAIRETVPKAEQTPAGQISFAIASNIATVDGIRQKLQPLATPNTVTLAREKYLASLGTIDPYLVVAKRVDSPSFYVVHRSNGNAVFVTSGLWDPAAAATTAATATTAAAAGSASEQQNTPIALPEIELLAEARESELGSDLANSWLFQCLLEVACTAKRNYNKVRRLLRERQYATMEVLDANTCLPPEFVDPTTGRACMLLGIDSDPNTPKYFKHDGTPIQIVTCKLLTLNQWRDSQEFAVGKRPLAARFSREGHHHTSSIVVAVRSIMERERIKRERENESSAEVNSPNKHARTSGVNRNIPLPNADWTVKRLIERVATAIQIDSAAKPKQPPLLTIPALVPARNTEGGAAVPASIGTTKVPPISSTSKIPGPPGGPTIMVPPIPAPPALVLDPIQPLGAIADYEPPVTTGVIVNAFEASDIARELCNISIELRKLLAPNSRAPEFARSAAQTVYGVLGTQSQLYGWQHVSEYIRNPLLYTERTKSLPPAGSNPNNPSSAAPAPTAGANPNDPSLWTARGPSEIHEAIDLLQETGHNVTKALVQRIEWIQQIFRRDNVSMNAEFIIQVVATDITWVGQAAAFMKACEERVAELLAKNPQRFNQFRELQKKGVQWPHSLEVRKAVEKTGFSFRPMMIKRDRCVCDTCGVELSGWRPWYDPRAFHDYSKHPAAFRTLMYPPAPVANPNAATVSAAVQPNAPSNAAPGMVSTDPRASMSPAPNPPSEANKEGAKGARNAQ